MSNPQFPKWACHRPSHRSTIRIPHPCVYSKRNRWTVVSFRLRQWASFFRVLAPASAMLHHAAAPLCAGQLTCCVYAASQRWLDPSCSQGPAAVGPCPRPQRLASLPRSRAAEPLHEVSSPFAMLAHLLLKRSRLRYRNSAWEAAASPPSPGTACASTSAK